jgi:hypothetical protein
MIRRKRLYQMMSITCLAGAAAAMPEQLTAAQTCTGTIYLCVQECDSGVDWVEECYSHWKGCFIGTPTCADNCNPGVDSVECTATGQP